MIIGITGSTRGGKNTAGEYIQQALQSTGIRLLTYNLADPLRNLARRVGLDVEDDRKEEPQHVWWGTPETLPATVQAWAAGWLVGEAPAYQAEVYSFILDSLEDRGYLQDGALLTSIRCSAREFMIAVGEAGRKADPEVWVKVLRRVEATAIASGCQGVVVCDVRKSIEAAECLVTVSVTGRSPLQTGRECDEELESLSGAADFHIYNTGTLDDLRLRCWEVVGELRGIVVGH